MRPLQKPLSGPGVFNIATTGLAARTRDFDALLRSPAHENGLGFVLARESRCATCTMT